MESKKTAAEAGSTAPGKSRVSHLVTAKTGGERLQWSSLGPQLGSLAGELSYRYALVLVWVMMGVIFAALRPHSFATTGNLRTIFSTQSVLVIVTLALIFPLIVGEFDLSIGATLGAAAIFIAVLNVQHDWPVGFVVLVAIAFGAIVGLVNGILVVLIGVNALVATLGIATLVTGIGFAASNYIIISGVTDDLVSAVTNKFLSLPFSFWYALALCIVIWYMFRYTPTGRHFIFVGAGLDVARLSGLPVRAIRMSAFIICGVLSAVAGVVLAGTLGGEDPNAGIGFLLPAYSAAFLGATVVTPGQFNPWGALIAVYFLVTGITGLQLLGLADWIQDIFYGATLVVAVTFAHLAAKRRVS